MGKSKDLSDKSQIMRARQLGQSSSKTSLAVCSLHAVDSTNHKWTKDDNDSSDRAMGSQGTLTFLL